MAYINKKYRPVVVVDENDNEISAAMLTEVWQKRLYHRIVSIFVKDDQGRMLLQLRAPNMLLYPNRWDQAAGGHVDSGHNYEETASIELAEEIGLHNVEFKTIATYRSNNRYDGRIMNRFVRVYLVRVAHDIVLHPEAEEVSKLQWFSPAELKERAAKHPEEFTPGFLNELQVYFP